MMTRIILFLTFFCANSFAQIDPGPAILVPPSVIPGLLGGANSGGSSIGGLSITGGSYQRQRSSVPTSFNIPSTFSGSIISPTAYTLPSADSLVVPKPFSGLDTDACGNIQCTLSGTSDTLTNLLNVTTLKDCSCRARIRSASEVYHDSSSESSLKAVCDCYKVQRNLNIGGIGFSGTLTSDGAEQIRKDLEISNHRAFGTFEYLNKGLAVFDNVQVFRNRKRLEKQRSKVATARTPAASGALQSDTDSASSQPTSRFAAASATDVDPTTNYRQSRPPTAPSGFSGAQFSDGLNDSEIAANMSQSKVTPEECLTIPNYLGSKKVPSGEALYLDLANFDSSSTKWTRELNTKWNITTLYDTLKNLPATADPSESGELYARIEFLYANPMYAALLSSTQEGSEKYKLALLQTIKQNYLPKPECRSKTGGPNCEYEALKNMKNIEESDQEFLGRNPDSVEFIKSAHRSRLEIFREEMDNNGDLYTLGDLGSMANTLTLPPMSASGVAIACAKLDQYTSSKQTVMAKNSEKAIDAANFWNGLGDKFSFSKESRGFKNLTKNICNTPHGSPVKKTFVQFAADRNKNCNSKTDSGAISKCWRDLQADYIENNFDLNSQLPDDLDAIHYARYLRATNDTANAEPVPATLVAQGLASAKSQPVVADVQQIQRDPTTGQASYVPTPQSSQRKSLSSAFPDERPATTSPAASTAATTTPTTDSSRSADVPIGRSPASTASTGPVYVPFVNVPTPAEIPQITAEAQVARTESNQLESQANALASVRSVTTDPTAKSTLDAQIAALTERANAADAKASALEAQLKAAERSARTPGSTTAGAAATPGPVDSSSSSTSGSARTNVTSAVTNPVAVPQAQSQVQAQSGFQSFGSGSGSVSVPLSTGASTSGSSKKNNASNFSFKYGSDARIDAGTNGAPSIIVSGTSSAFTATQDLAQAVDRSPIVPIKDVITSDEADLLVNYDIETIRKYVSRSSSPIKPGPFRLTFTYGNGQKGEIVGMMNENGQAINFPRMKSLAQLRTQLGSVSNQ